MEKDGDGKFSAQWIIDKDEYVQFVVTVGQRKNLSIQQDLNPSTPRYQFRALTNWATETRLIKAEY